MLFWQSFAIAVEMLRLHKLRAFLTMLGVIIGVMSVTMIVMISNGFQHYIETEFKRLGSDTIFVFFDPGRRRPGELLGAVEGLTMDDVTYLEARVPELDIAAPIMQIPQQPVVRGSAQVDNPRIFASNEYFGALNRLRVLQGRSLTERDVRLRANVAIIGEEIRDRLFPNEDPIGKFVAFKGIALEVIGVYERIDFLGETTGRDVLLPITTAQDKWIGGNTIMMITLRPKPGFTVDETADAVWQSLMLRSKNRPIYRVDSRESILGVFTGIMNFAGVVLAAIAALSLLVGGIGIMNIMLVSVTERTREIGLRKAVGAKRPAILLQFLVEAATLSLIGGLIGMFTAWMIGNVVTLVTLAMKWPSAGGLATPFPLSSALLAAGFSAMIGVVFGLFPALSASRLDPIEALRHE
jgi:putative ABC transport system permease protein